MGLTLPYLADRASGGRQRRERGISVYQADSKGRRIQRVERSPGEGCLHPPWECGLQGTDALVFPASLPGRSTLDPA